MSSDPPPPSAPVPEPTAVPPAAWNALTDSGGRKELLERKIVLPILHRELAHKHGLAPARALLLFGPPGTGKTHFTRAIAARLGWALIEADLSAVALQPARLARLFRELFARREVVGFFDEFEHLGMRRAPDNAGGRPVTNEFLKGLDALSNDDNLLLVCATNHVDLLDPALLRPGRFDFILPVGPPDAAARRHLLEGRQACSENADVDLERASGAAEGLTAADIGEVWNRAAQQAFERELTSRRTARVTTEDVLTAVETHRPSLSPDDLAAFEQQVREFARV